MSHGEGGPSPLMGGGLWPNVSNHVLTTWPLTGFRLLCGCAKQQVGLQRHLAVGLTAQTRQPEAHALMLRILERLGAASSPPT